jgi:hypothetical protein
MNAAIQTLSARFLVFLLLILACGTVAAQEEQASPLLQILAVIPDDAAVGESFSYVDFRAVTESRAGAATITTTEQYEELSASEPPEFGLFLAAYFGISSGPADFLQYLITLVEGMLELTGIDPFTVERAVAYGIPPGEVSILQGDFDETKIAAAHSLRDYVENTVAGFSLWCGNEECDGTRLDLASRDPANPFGGALGRRQAVLVGDGFVASSASTERLEQLAQAAAGNVDTLADNPDYRAAAEAISREGMLRQMWFIEPAQIPPLSEAAMAELFGSRLSASEVEDLFAELTETMIPMPAYSLLAFADTATESEQIALVALVYDDVEDAESAAEPLIQRIDGYVSFVSEQPMREMLEDRGLSQITTEVYEGDKRAVLLVQLHGALAPSEPEENSDRLTSSSLIFRLLANMYMQRDIAWLAIVP